MNGTLNLTRRQFGLGAGALLATFAVARTPAFAQAKPPYSFKNNPRLQGWIHLGEDGRVTVFTGKAELGQGIDTALAQIVADELDVGMDAIKVIGPDTAFSPNEGYTYGSQSVEQSGSALRAAAALSRAKLIEAAAKRLKVKPETLTAANGVITAKTGAKVTYGELAASDADLLTGGLDHLVAPKSYKTYKYVGKPVERMDLLSKIRAEPSYVQDLRLPGMLFGRPVRPPRYGAKLVSLDVDKIKAMPGVVAVVKNGSFVGVVAEREEQAIAARQAVIDSAKWDDAHHDLPSQDDLKEALKGFKQEEKVLVSDEKTTKAGATAKTVKASFSRPYLSQASIGPSCAAAHFVDGTMKVWTHTQGAYPLRGDLAKVLKLADEKVDVIHSWGSGCYGHNGADDVALDAALLAQAVPGRPVKVQWMRDDEFGWAPISPAMTFEIEAGLSADGKITEWTYELWSNSHANRPGQPGGVNLLASWDLAEPFQPGAYLDIPQPFGNGDRNAIPLYDLPNRKITNHILTEMPIRTSSLRTLGAHGNIFAIEAFMDELAEAAGQDPVAFRLANLGDPRGRAVIEAVAKKVNWDPKAKSGEGRATGFAYTRYKNIQTYAAVAVDASVDAKTGAITVHHVTTAIDVGQIVNPDGVRSQAEGCVIQGLSWTLMEQMNFDREMVTSRDWSGYPIMTYDQVPSIDVILLDHPELPSLGAGEGAVGPSSAALVNAVSKALGKRVRDLPLLPERIKATQA